MAVSDDTLDTYLDIWENDTDIVTITTNTDNYLIKQKGYDTYVIEGKEVLYHKKDGSAYILNCADNNLGIYYCNNRDNIITQIDEVQLKSYLYQWENDID